VIIHTRRPNHGARGKKNEELQYELKLALLILVAILLCSYSGLI